MVRSKCSSVNFNPKVIEAVDAMTRRREESSDDFVLRAATNPNK